MKRSFGLDRQLSLYRDGMDGEESGQVVSYERLRERAREVLPREAFDYVDGGAGRGDTMRANRGAFDRWRIVPRVLRGVGQPDLGVELLGHKLRWPVLLAPIGVQGCLHREAELATARGVAPLDVPMVLSTVSSQPLEKVADAMGAVPHWFQLYWSKNHDFVVSLLDRASRKSSMNCFGRW